ncbi:MAG: hypothetical protein ABR611_03380 [Chthoniobacterales bacterium]
MSTIKGQPYFQAKFDKDGAALNSISLPAGTTDVFVISHGWRNDENDASQLYTTLFDNFFDLAAGQLGGRKCAIVGVFWPSRNFDALVAAQGAGSAQNAAAIGDAVSDPESQQKVIERLEALKAPGLFDEPAQKQALSEAQALVPKLDKNATARTDFMKNLRSLMEPDPAAKEDGSDIFRTMDATDLFHRLNIPAVAVDKDIAKTGKAMALHPAGCVAIEGHAAGILDIFKGAAAAATNSVSYLSYFMMKQRAGVVGEKGVAPLIDKLAADTKRIHLIGHSFGGRVVAATAKASTNDKIQSVSFLQAAFSHNGFSPPGQMNGFFRSVIDKHRVKGPLIATYTKNDTAVGIAYPLASRISGTVAAALGDENDKYGGLGRNGAQKMNANEVVKAQLLAVGGAYQLKPGLIHNLLADAFISNHGDVTGKEVASAIAAAAFS